MEKEKYESAEIEVIEIRKKDIITASQGDANTDPTEIQTTP